MRLASKSTTRNCLVFLAILLAAAAIAQADPTAGLLAYWSFNAGDATDDSGNGFHGVSSGNITPAPGVLGTALQFGGGSSVIEVAGDDLGMTPSRVRTVTLWALPTAISSPTGGGATVGIVLSKYRHFDLASSDYYASFNQRPTSGLEARITGQGSDVVDVIGGVVLDEWQHYAYVFRAGVGASKIYRNGVLIGAGTLSYSAGISPEPLRIGNSVGAGDQGYEGLLDEIRIYDRELSPMEIDSLSSTTPVLTCLGFEAPAASSPLTVRGNRALPLKAELIDELGAEITDLDLLAPPVLQVLYQAGSGGSPVDVTDDALPAGQGTDGNQFEYSDHWRYNLKTKNYSASGSYFVSMESGDPSEYQISPTCAVELIVD